MNSVQESEQPFCVNTAIQPAHVSLALNGKFYIMKFHADHIRAIAFLQPRVDLDSDAFMKSVWDRISDLQPDEDSSKPKEFQRSFILALDAFRSLKLTMSPLRVDMVISVTSIDQSVFPELEQMLIEFGRMRDAFFGGMEGIARIGVGGGFLVFTNSVRESYELLGQSIPSFTDATSGVSDFIYRLNRPTFSQLEKELKVNRLTTWAGVHIKGLAVTEPEPLNMADQHAMRVEVDINTDAERRNPLSCDLVALGKELTEVVVDRLEKGDRP